MELVRFIGADTEGFVAEAGVVFTFVVEGKNGSEKGCELPATAPDAASGVFDDAVDAAGDVGAAFLVAGAVATVRNEMRDGCVVDGWLDRRARSVRRQLLHSILSTQNFLRNGARIPVCVVKEGT